MFYVVAVAAAATPPPKHFDLPDLARLTYLADPQISPDGKSIALIAARPNYEDKRYDTELVLVEIVTKEPRVLTRERQGVSQPRWSPSGDRLAFLARVGAGKEAKPQLFVMPMQGGDAQRITSVTNGVQQFAWRPDGREFAFVTADEPENKKAMEKGDDAFEVGNNDFLTTSAPMPSHLWRVSADGNEVHRLTSGSWSLPVVPPPNPPPSPLAWSPDGHSIAFVRQATPYSGDNDQTRVQILDVASGSIRSLTGRSLLESFPSFSPDGSRIAYGYPREGNPLNVIEVNVAPLSGGTGEAVTRALDRCLYRSIWMPDGQSLLVGGNDGRHVSLWLQPLQGAARRLELGDIQPNSFFWLEAAVGKHGAIAFIGRKSNHPDELYYLDTPTSRLQPLTHFNQPITELELGRVETLEWQSPDGFTENGVLTYPPDFTGERKWPLVLLIHGGPQLASTEGFNDLAQLLAARGHIVFEPNYRGSDNLGNAYMSAIYNDASAGPGRDVMLGLEAVTRRGFVDTNRMAVTGWSYGGYMTTWLIGHYHVWKAAVAGAAVTDWLDTYALADFNVQVKYCFGGPPGVGNFERAYREQSPITYATSIKTPTLILATTGDYRVPITQSYRLYHTLRDNGVPTQFIAYPAAGHWPDDPVRTRDIFRRWIEWVNQYLNPKTVEKSY